MWSSIEEQLMVYHELSPEEQREVEQYVREHPEKTPLLEDARAFSALLQEANLLHADPPGDEALAYYIATRHVSTHEVPASLQAAFAQIEARLTTDEPLRARCEELVGRMATLEAASDPVEQFERLSGHRLAPEAAPATPSETEAAAPPVIYRLWGRAGRFAAAAVVFCLVLYGALAFVSQASRSDLDRLAAFEAADTEGLRMRSGVVTQPDYVSSEDLYEQALEALQSARKHTLGLFPHYDQQQLDEAAGLLRSVVEQDPDDSPLRAQANFLLAKICLAQEDVAGARAALQAVLDGSGWKAPEARALLEKLDALAQFDIRH